MWKQPTPTDGLYNPNLNELDWMIFLFAWNMVRREPGVSEFKHGGRFYSVELQRGQCIFAVRRIAKVLEIDRRRVQKSIDKLGKWYTELDQVAKPYGLILTFKRADEMLKMYHELDQSGTTEVPQKYHRSTTKKNVEIGKIAETGERKKIKNKKKIFSAQPQSQKLGQEIQLDRESGDELFTGKKGKYQDDGGDILGPPIEEMKFFEWKEVPE